MVEPDLRERITLEDLQDLRDTAEAAMFARWDGDQTALTAALARVELRADYLLGKLGPAMTALEAAWGAEVDRAVRRGGK